MADEFDPSSGAQTSSQQQQRRRTWIRYVLLVSCRVVLCPFLPGYIHPDEFFQGGQELWFGCPPFAPWEFEQSHALRSIVPPTIMTWTPLQMYSWLVETSMYNLSGREILVVPRIFCGLLSILTIDLSIWYLTASSSSRSGVPTAVLLVASAWPTLVLMNRPFTNALETMLLASLLLVTNASQRFANDIITGIFCALGLFTRFTFVFVAMPTVLCYLTNKLSLPLSRVFISLGILGMSFVGTAAAILYADVLYYGIPRDDSWTSFITPLNALWYNSKVENLAQHGLHPRWTHAVINMMLLYGPLAVMFYIILGSRICALLKRHTSESKGDDTVILPRTIILRNTCLWTVMSGLGFLSMAPHQEPRFLLPLLVPLVILASHHNTTTAAWFRAFWIVFNVILLLLFGMFHQGGILPSLTMTSTLVGIQGNVPQAVFYYHTYMPPTFVSRTRIAEAKSCSLEADTRGSKYRAMETLACNEYNIVDLKGSSAEELLTALDKHLLCGDEENNDNCVYLVSPRLKMGTKLIGPEECSLGASYRCRRLHSYRPHLTTEDLPAFDGSIWSLLSSFELATYEITCQQYKIDGYV